MEFEYGFVLNLLSSIWKSIDVCTIVWVCLVLGIESINTWFGNSQSHFLLELS